MNKMRRNAVQKVINELSDVKDKMKELLTDIERIENEEYDAFENLPEGIQQSDRGYIMEENVNKLQDIEDALETVIDQLEENVLDVLCEVD